MSWKETTFEGTLEAVVTYAGGAVGLKGIVEGVYPRPDKARGGVMTLKLRAAIESRP